MPAQSVEVSDGPAVVAGRGCLAVVAADPAVVAGREITNHRLHWQRAGVKNREESKVLR